MLKLFCCSDTHGESPPRPPDDTNFVLHAGDFYNLIGGKSKGLSHKEFARFKNNRTTLTEWKSNLKCPSLFVRGNHDTDDLYGIFGPDKEADVSGKVIQLRENLFLVGIGWSGQFYFELPEESDLAEVCYKVLTQATSEMKDGDHSIILTHYPSLLEGSPRSEGFRFQTVERLVSALSPILLVEGHIHYDYPVVSVDKNGTVVLSPSSKGASVTLSDDQTQVLEVSYGNNSMYRNNP